MRESIDRYHKRHHRETPALTQEQKWRLEEERHQAAKYREKRDAIKGSVDSYLNE